jgi:hypothetical protein
MQRVVLGQSMIELATIKAVVDLFKDLVGLVKQREQDKREAFERTCKPLYDRLEIVFKQYYAMVATTARQLDKPKPNFEAVLREMKKQRDAVVIARNGILGEAEALLNIDGDPAREGVMKARSFERLVRAFASDIVALFVPPYVAADLTDDDELRSVLREFVLRDLERLSWEKKGGLESIASTLLFYLGEFGNTPFYDKTNIAIRCRRFLREYSAVLKYELENRWQSLSIHFTQLKLYCEG